MTTNRYPTTDEFAALLDDDRDFQLIRNLMIDPATPDDELRSYIAELNETIADDQLNDLRATACALIDNDDARETLTACLLMLSLCPLHRIDYAICFDDDDAECAAIRTIHPSHDS